MKEFYLSPWLLPLNLWKLFDPQGLRVMASEQGFLENYTIQTTQHMIYSAWGNKQVSLQRLWSQYLTGKTSPHSLPGAEGPSPDRMPETDRDTWGGKETATVRSTQQTLRTLFAWALCHQDINAWPKGVCLPEPVKNIDPHLVHSAIIQFFHFWYLIRTTKKNVVLSKPLKLCVCFKNNNKNNNKSTVNNRARGRPLTVLHRPSGGPDLNTPPLFIH